MKLPASVNLNRLRKGHPFALLFLCLKFDNARLKFLIRIQRFRQVLLELRVLRLECFDNFDLWSLESNRRFFHGLRLLLFSSPNAPRQALPSSSRLGADVGTGKGGNTE
jgi:hypothetical protein